MLQYGGAGQSGHTSASSFQLKAGSAAPQVAGHPKRPWGTAVLQMLYESPSHNHWFGPHCRRLKP